MHTPSPTPPPAAVAEAEGLTAALLAHQQAYYVAGRPTVSDLEYDRLFDRLVELETQYPALKHPNSPTSRVGSDLASDLPESPHTVPVLSLDKAYAVSELEEWARKTAKNAGEALTAVLEEKMDGVSIVLYYVGGQLERAVTRGNGRIGNEVTANVRTLRSIPLRLSQPWTVAVRGEIFLPKDKFAGLNAALDEPYANPRNLAAGTIRRKNSAEVAKVPLAIYCYEGFFEPPLRTHVEALAALRQEGFPLNPNLAVFCDQPEALEPGQKQALDRLQTSVQPWAELSAVVARRAEARNSLAYEIDGLVLKVDNLAVRDSLGYTGHHPRWAIAFKFESPQGLTVVEDVFVQVGRTGRVTPVARVRPVQVSGSTITFITLHNQAYIDSLELGVGDEVVISRRGDVIPALERVVESHSEHVWQFPGDCPSCRTALVLDGAHHFCPNPDCPDQVRGRIAFFVGKGQMDIETLGPETLDVLMARGLVRDLPDLYTCDFDSLKDVPGFGERKIALLKEGVAASRQRPFQTVLASLGVPDLGKKLAELLIGAGFLDIDAILAALDQPEQLLAIHGLGEKTIQTLSRELRDPRVLARIAGLRAAGLAFAAEAPSGPQSEALAGTSWCVTGSFAAFNPRSKAEDEIKARGGKVVSAVSGNTTHLLAGEKAGSKLQKAGELGVTIVTEDEFVRLLAENPLQ